MINSLDFLQRVTIERPVGTEKNDILLKYMEELFINEGYSVTSLPFDCIVWEYGESILTIGAIKLSISASPFSQYFNGTGKVLFINSIEELKEKQLKDKILIIYGSLAQGALQPKDFPFYYPNEHKEIISILEIQNPKAIISLTGKSQFNGMNPFPMFEDGNFLIPTAYASHNLLPEILELIKNKSDIQLEIKSKNKPSKSKQLVASKKVKKSLGKIIICAHMDSKYNTKGALDNATGVAVLMKLMESLKSIETKFDIDFVPFNSEEYFGVNGQLKYFDYIIEEKSKIKLVINIDSPCHQNSKTAISYYNLENNIVTQLDNIIQNNKHIVKGDKWFAGDHCTFAFNEIPCLAVTSSDFYDGALDYTHTSLDTLDTIDSELILPTVLFLLEIIKNLNC
ncbi:M28 family metallopeptidase [Clostridium sp. SHJSY1]|uniref:M28 family metallopeptidase n=1 Tax=Clostridium sp. SHJSY1 TaxID=2942483 RepID=UPI0028759DD7|nr:M28 family metallopeptidase [Clostridium sp. SHJSY1]MDS0525159.1 M28 family metallopeptidase [Clostridium sp. SHJSY1]